MAHNRKRRRRRTSAATASEQDSLEVGQTRPVDDRVDDCIDGQEPIANAGQDSKPRLYSNTTRGRIEGQSELWREVRE